MKTKKLLSLALALLLLLGTVPAVFAAALPTPQNVKIYTSDGYIQLNWDKPSDMDMMSVKSGRVLYSEDGSNWLVAKSVSKGAALASFEEPEEGAFASGKTYDFCVCWVDWSGNEGSRSNVVSATYANSALGVQADWDQITAGYDSFGVTETGTSYNKVNFKKGMRVVFDTPLYTLSAQIADLKGTKATIKATLNDKIDGGDYFYIDYLTGAWKGAGKGIFYSGMDKRTLSETINLNDLIDGACSLTFGVKMSLGAAFNGLSTYRKYVDDYDFGHFDQKHTIYFQNAPAAGKLAQNTVSATRTASRWAAPIKRQTRPRKAPARLYITKPLPRRNGAARPLPPAKRSSWSS